MRNLLAAAILVFALATNARADAGFYAGRTVNFVIGFGVNTGYDIYARMVSPYLSKYLPGHPNVVAQNMPGAGSLTAINYLYNIAPRDGTSIGMIDQAAALTELLAPQGFRADVAKFNWIGRITGNAAVLFAWHTAAVQRIEDAFAKKLIISASGQNSRMMSNLLKNLLGLKFDIVTGYPSSADSLLAIERGEVDAMTMPWSVLHSEKPDWITQKEINLLLQMGSESHPDLVAVPLVTGLARTNEERRILDLMTSDTRVGRSIMSPPGEPPDRIAELRAAFMSSVKDPDFLAEIKRAGLDLDPMAGSALQSLMQSATDVPADLVIKAKQLADVRD